VEVLENIPPRDWVILGSAVAFGWALSWGFRLYRAHRLHKAMVATVTAAASDHLRDIMVPDGMGGAFHLDFLLLTPRGLLVIDLRDISGNIFGGDQMNEWTVMDRSHRHTFPNPQSGLYDRIAAVKAVAGDIPVEGRIVFTRRGKFPKGLPKFTLMVDSLRTEYPAIEKSALSATMGRFDDAWQRVKSAVTPSPMSQVRPTALP